MTADMPVTHVEYDRCTDQYHYECFFDDCPSPVGELRNSRWDAERDAVEHDATHADWEVTR